MKKHKIRLSADGFGVFIDHVLFGFDYYALKIEKPLKKTVLNIEAARIYLPELKKEINQTTERGEHPTLYIKKTRREKTGATEFEIVLMGRPSERHTEDLAYFTKQLDDWKSWGELVLNERQAREFLRFLEDALKSD